MNPQWRALGSIDDGEVLAWNVRWDGFDLALSQAEVSSLQQLGNYSCHSANTSSARGRADQPDASPSSKSCIAMSATHSGSLFTTMLRTV